MSTSSLVFKGKKLTSKNNYLEQLPEAKLFLEVNEFMPFIDNSIKAPNKCHEHMNRDWESQLNCLYYDDTKLKKEEGS